MALIKCDECGKDISIQATKCTNCGAATKTGKRGQIVIGVVVIAIVAAIGSFLGLMLAM